MNIDDILKSLLALIVLGLSFFVKLLFKKFSDLDDIVAKHKEDIHEINVSLPTNYVTKQEFSRSVDALFRKLEETQEHFDTRLDRLYEKLDAKADKD